MSIEQRALGFCIRGHQIGCTKGPEIRKCLYRDGQGREVVCRYFSDREECAFHLWMEGIGLENNPKPGATRNSIVLRDLRTKEAVQVLLITARNGQVHKVAVEREVVEPRVCPNCISDRQEMLVVLGKGLSQAPTG